MKDVFTIDDLRDWRADDSGQRIALGVIGDPVAHSLSPQMHNAALAELGMDVRYARFQVAPGELGTAAALMREAGFVGANVTIPHKAEALELVDEATGHARRMQSVNTLLFERDGGLSGFSTDGPGLVRAVRDEFSLDIRDLRVMVLGAGGGAGRAIAIQCAIERCERLVLANRTLDKARQVLAEVRADFESDRLSGPGERLAAIELTPEAVESEIGSVDLVVNATSLGMKRTDASPVPATLLSAYHLVYDTVYAGGKTKLVEAAATVGARAASGLSMLLHQGALSFEIWFGKAPPLETMRRALDQSA